MPKTPRKKSIEKKDKQMGSPEPTATTAVDTALEEIYLEPDGTMPDMRRIEHHKGRPGLVITFFVLLFMAAAGAAAWFGFFLFSPTQKFSEEQVVLDITAPEKIVAGQQYEFQLTIKNTGQLALATSEINITPPPNLIVTDSEPKAVSEKNDRWLIGAIDANTTKTIRLTGVGSLSPESIQPLRALLTFRPANFNADFQKTFDKNLPVVTAALALMAEQKSSNDKQIINVKYKNLNALPMTDSKLTITLAPEFKIEKTGATVGKIIGNVFELVIPQIDPEQEATVQITGSGAPENNPPIQAKLEKTFGAQTILLAELKKSAAGPITTVNQPLTLTNSTGATNPAIKPGDPLELELVYTNITAQTIKDAVLTLVVEAPSIKNKSVFDFSDLQTNGEPEIIGKQITPDTRRATITWSATGLPELKSIAPGKTLTVKARLTLKAAMQIDEAPKNFTANAIATLTNSEINFSTPPLTVSLLSNLALNSKTELLDPSVSGQMALTADELGYEIKITAHNSWHDLENLTIRVPIFSDNKIQAKEATAGTITNDNKNLILWTITKWPANIKEQTLTLRLAVKKSVAQTALSENISATATDTASQRTISLNDSAINKP